MDDEAHERAEVSFALPDLLVLSGEDMADAAGWPEFGPAVVTPEARRRGVMYAQRRRRQEEARAFGGSREEFLRYCGTAITMSWAQPPDVPRLHELSVRTHQFNSTGEEVSEAAFSALLGSAESRVVTVRLSDRFGDDGLVGGCVIGAGAGDWTVRLLMMSCRAIGRGVIDVLLAWLARAAARDGAVMLNIGCRLADRNMPLRLALAGAVPGQPGQRDRGGGRVQQAADRAAAGAARLGERPGGTLSGGAGQPVIDQVREILADVTGRPELASLPPQTSLFGPGVGLDSLAGTLLLRRVRARFGVDVAAEDLNLDALATLATLTAFIEERARPGPAMTQLPGAPRA